MNACALAATAARVTSSIEGSSSPSSRRLNRSDSYPAYGYSSSVRPSPLVFSSPKTMFLRSVRLNKVGSCATSDTRRFNHRGHRSPRSKPSKVTEPSLGA